VTSRAVDPAQARAGGRRAAPPHRPVVRAAWWPDVLGAVAALSMLVVVALWVVDRGLQGLGAAASATTSLGRLTGLVAADLLLVQVF
jgi:hypothetical protein